MEAFKGHQDSVVAREIGKVTFSTSTVAVRGGGQMSDLDSFLLWGEKDRWFGHQTK